MRTGDRLFLESRLFREVTLNFDNLKILFIGVHKYSSWYATIFNRLTSNTFYTIDLSYDYSDSKFSNSYHTIGDFLKHKFNYKFDIIFLNGVFGYGIDDSETQKEAVKKICNLMNNESSYFVFGYRDRIDLKNDVNKLINNKLYKVNFENIVSDLIVNTNNNHKFSFWRQD
jgi:hypothetical protein